MKKLIVFLLAVICAFVLIGCSQTQTKYKVKVSVDGNEKDDALIGSLNLRESYAEGEDVTLKLKRSPTGEYSYYLYLNGEWLPPNTSLSDSDLNFVYFSFVMPSKDALVQITKMPIPVSAPKDKFPQYFNLQTTKGLEVYVWEDADGMYYCGVLSGTNRNRTNAEMARLAENGATVAEMKAILSTYDIDEREISVIPVKNPSSNYEIDNTAFAKANELFWGSIDDYVIEEGGAKYIYLPVSQTKVDIQKYASRLDEIEPRLLKSADEKWSDFCSSLTDAPTLSLQTNGSTQLFLYASSVVKIDPPRPKTLEDGTVLTSGCDVDHRHVFFTATVTK